MKNPSSIQKNYICKQINTSPLIRYFIIFIFVVLANFGSQAQAKLCFNILTTSGCVPFTVQLQDCSTGVGLPSYNYYGVGDGTSQTFSKSNTYTVPGIYRIYQLGNVNGKLDTISKNVTVFGVVPITYTLEKCNNNSVLITPTSLYQSYTFYTSPSSSQVINLGSTWHNSYPNNSPQTITIAGNNPGGCSTTIGVTFTPNPDLSKPSVEKLIVKNKTATTADFTLYFYAKSYFNYSLQYQANGSNSYVNSGTISNANGLTSYTFSNLPTFNTYYTFQVLATDACDPAVGSELVTSINLAVTAQNQANQLLWTNVPLDSLVSFGVYVNGAPLTSFTGTNFNTQFTDKNVICNQKYCYNAVATFLSNTDTSYTSFSDTVCVKAISNNTPPAVTNLFSTITTNSILLSWSYAGTSSKKVILERSSNNISFSKIDTNSFKSFMDPNADPSSQQYYYRMKYIDSCGNTSNYSNVTSPILLKYGTSLGSSVSLNWSNYVGYSISDYYIEKRDESGNIYFTLNIGNKPTNYTETPKDTISQKFYYRIKGMPIDPTAFPTYSNELEYILQPKLLVPNAFTPNGDGLNDVFLPKTLFISSFALTVYNSWGEAIFHSNDLSQGWDGKKGGQECPVGVYAYTVDVSDPNGNKLSSRGTVTLLK